MSAKTYRLPPEMGGGECIIEDARTDLGWPNHWVVRIPSEAVGGWFVLVPKDALTEVVPPLPEEPGHGTVVLDRFIRAWQYVGGGRGDWCCTEDDLGADWEELNREHGPLTRLVPEPVVEPVTLPWTVSGADKHGNREALVEMSHSVAGRVFVDALSQHLTPDTADAMAAALMTAAAKARQS